MKFTHYIEQTVELPDPKDPNGIASFSTDLQKKLRIMFADAKAIETSIDPNHLTVEPIYTFNEGKPFRAIY